MNTSSSQESHAPWGVTSLRMNKFTGVINKVKGVIKTGQAFNNMPSQVRETHTLIEDMNEKMNDFNELKEQFSQHKDSQFQQNNNFEEFKKEYYDKTESINAKLDHMIARDGAKDGNANSYKTMFGSTVFAMLTSFAVNEAHRKYHAKEDATGQKKLFDDQTKQQQDLFDKQKQELLDSHKGTQDLLNVKIQNLEQQLASQRMPTNMEPNIIAQDNNIANVEQRANMEHANVEQRANVERPQVERDGLARLWKNK